MRLGFVLAPRSSNAVANAQDLPEPRPPQKILYLDGGSSSLKALGSDMLFPGDFVGCDCDWGIFVAGMFNRLEVWQVLAD